MRRTNKVWSGRQDREVKGISSKFIVFFKKKKKALIISNHIFFNKTCCQLTIKSLVDNSSNSSYTRLIFNKVS